MLSDDAVIELKTNRSFKRKIKDYYLEQIKLYCVATQKRKAILIIIWQNAAREIADERLQTTKIAARAIEAYDIKFTQYEMQVARKQIEKRYFDLTTALINKTPQTLRAVKHDELLRKITCGYCKYRYECDQADKPADRVFTFRAKKA